MDYDTEEDVTEMRPRRRRPGVRKALMWAVPLAVACFGVGDVAGSMYTLSTVNQTGAHDPTGIAVVAPQGVVRTTSYQASGQNTPGATNALSTGVIPTAVNRVISSVVGVINLQYASASGGSGQRLQDYGEGSGVIISGTGYIVTDNHVVEGAAKVRVVFANGKFADAKVVGTDAYTDLAVLQVPAADIPANSVAVFGDSAALQPGQTAIAIGNPAGLDFADTVTVGVISATQRSMPVQDEVTGQVLGQETVLQTDAAINPGNSGGPLCNVDGQVIGIASSKIVAQGFEGMGFAIPSNEVQLVAQQIIATGHAVHAVIGILGESMTSAALDGTVSGAPTNQGVYVATVQSADAKASGLKSGDIIVSIDGQPVKSLTDLQTTLWQYKPGQTVTLQVYRGSTEMSLSLTLTELQPYKAPAASTTQGSSNWWQGPGGGGNSGGPYGNPYGGSSQGGGYGGFFGSSPGF